MTDSKTRLYRIWQKMKNRCYDKNNTCYSCYGGRGIIVCEKWKNNFKAFKQWSLENGYDDSLTIDRIDVNGNYEPSNCRWTTMKVQANNTRRNHNITYNGETKTLSQWAEYLNINRHTLHVRINIRKWSIERAFTTPAKPFIKYNSDKERTESQKQQRQKYYQENKESILSKNRKYYETHKETISKKNKEYRLNHIEKYKTNYKEWLEENKEYKKEKDKIYRRTHKEQVAESKSKWYEQNKQRLQNKESRLCTDPRTKNKTCTYRALKIYASRYNNSSLVQGMNPSEWAEQFVIKS